jgi:hypothetical protein
MPAIRKKSRSPYWFGCFTLPDGRRTQRSTKTANRRVAFKIASEWEEAARRRLTESQARRVLSDIHELIHGAPLSSPTVADYVAQWLARKKGETTGVTFKLYEHTANEFRDWLADKATQPIHYVTPAVVATWRDKAAEKSTPRTANNKLKIVRNLFQTAWRDGLITENPAAKVQTLKAVGGNRRPFTLDELTILLGVASQEWRGMILAALYTDQRLKDIASLTWANVDLERDEFRFATSKTGRRDRCAGTSKHCPPATIRAPRSFRPPSESPRSTAIRRRSASNSMMCWSRPALPCLARQNGRPRAKAGKVPG